MVIEDVGNGELKVKVTGLVDHDLVQYYKKDGGVSLHFKNDVDAELFGLRFFGAFFVSAQH